MQNIKTLLFLVTNNPVVPLIAILQESCIEMKLLLISYIPITESNKIILTCQTNAIHLLKKKKKIENLYAETSEATTDCWNYQ